LVQPQLALVRLSFDAPKAFREVDNLTLERIKITDAAETAIFIKRTFGFQPERGAIKTLVTIQDLYDYIEQNI
jgi:hypothetical protein